MQVFGLPRHIIRGAAVASRLSNASPSGSSLERRDAVERWVGARRDGLSAAKAARAVGVARTTLYRWSQRCEFKSRRPHNLRAAPSSGAGGRGGASAPRLSDVGQGEDRPAGARDRLPGQRFDGGTHPAQPDRARARAGGSRSFAQARAARGLEGPALRGAQAQASRVQPARRRRADRHAVDLAAAGARDQAVHGLRSARQMDGRRALCARHRQERRRVLKPRAGANALSQRRYRSTAAPNSWPSSNSPVGTPSWRSTSCRLARPSSTARSNAATALGATSSTPATICR
jgi:hypothetical protein